MREHYSRLYALHGAMCAGFAQFNAFGQDAIDNLGYLEAGKLTFPVLAVGGEASNGDRTQHLMAFVAHEVQGAIVPAAAHWLMEEHPQATVDLVQRFLA